MKKEVVIGVIVVVVVLGVLWYLISPVFIDNGVSEPTPVTSPSSVDLGIVGETKDVYSGSFVGADSFHKVSGQARVIEDSGVRYLRLENFESINGPDLKVYLSEDLNAESYLSLGDLKGNIGSQNYEISSDVDIEKYDKVLIWCEQFSVLFGSADLEKA